MHPSRNDALFAFGKNLQRSRSAIESKLKFMNLPVADSTLQIKKKCDELTRLNCRIQDMVR